jgi:hypothetical protein
MVDAAVAGRLVEMLGRVVEGVWRARRPADPRPVGTLADLLAKAVDEQWRQEAAERMLVTPAPIPVPPELVKTGVRTNMFGLVFGLAAGIVTVHSYHLGLVVGLIVGLVAWLVVGFVFGIMPRLAGGFVTGLALGFADGEPSPQGPRESWRHDQAFRLPIGLWFGPVLGLENFLTGEFSVALVYGITSSVARSTTLAWRQLRRACRVPAVAMMPFLEDARGRGVLRTAGAVYQFQHATLQDQLAGHTTGSPQTSSTTQIGRKPAYYQASTRCLDGSLVVRAGHRHSAIVDPKSGAGSTVLTGWLAAVDDLWYLTRRDPEPGERRPSKRHGRGTTYY